MYIFFYKKKSKVKILILPVLLWYFRRHESANHVFFSSTIKIQADILEVVEKSILRKKYRHKRQFAINLSTTNTIHKKIKS